MTDRSDGEREGDEGLDELQPPASGLRTASEIEAQEAATEDTAAGDTEAGSSALDELQPPASELRSAVEQDGTNDHDGGEGDRDE